MRLFPHMEQLNPLFRTCVAEPAAGHTLLDAFVSNAPAYTLLKHPKTLARTAGEIVRS